MSARRSLGLRGPSLGKHHDRETTVQAPDVLRARTDEHCPGVSGMIPVRLSSSGRYPARSRVGKTARRLLCPTIVGELSLRLGAISSNARLPICLLGKALPALSPQRGSASIALPKKTKEECLKRRGGKPPCWKCHAGTDAERDASATPPSTASATDCTIRLWRQWPHPPAGRAGSAAAVKLAAFSASISGFGRGE